MQAGDVSARKRWLTVVLCVLLIGGAVQYAQDRPALAREPLVIAASPSVKAPLEALGRAFEVLHPGVVVRLYLDEALNLRRTIAALENNGQFLGGRGIIHLVAPGGDELLTRLASKNYIRPESRRAYAVEPLVLVVPESVVEAPTSFDALARDAHLRIAVADPALTTLGQRSRDLLLTRGVWANLNGRLELAADARGVIDHLMRGQADVGILFGPEAVQERERLRVTAVARGETVAQTVHSIAMEWQCPNRELAQEFIRFTQSASAQAILRALGYLSPGLP